MDIDIKLQMVILVVAVGVLDIIIPSQMICLIVTGVAAITAIFIFAAGIGVGRVTDMIIVLLTAIILCLLTFFLSLSPKQLQEKEMPPAPPDSLSHLQPADATPQPAFFI